MVVTIISKCFTCIQKWWQGEPQEPPSQPAENKPMIRRPSVDFPIFQNSNTPPRTTLTRTLSIK